MDWGKKTIFIKQNTPFCFQVRDSHMAAAAKPPDFATQIDEEDIEVSDCAEIFLSTPYHLHR